MMTIVDYGLGNLGSVRNMLKRIGVPSVIASSPEGIESATRLILPGVGSFETGMRNLHARNLVSVLQRRVLEERIPILGICLGMQLFTYHSEEGDVSGLWWVDATTERFRSESLVGLRVPHMGWNVIRPSLKHPLLEGLRDEPRFYFVHSYYVRCTNPGDVLATSEHGAEFVAALVSKNIVGIQAHPEKSHRFGWTFLKNFAEWIPECSYPA